MLNVSPALASIFFGIAAGFSIVFIGVNPALLREIPKWLWLIPLIYLSQALGTILSFGIQPDSEHLRKMLVKLPLMFLPFFYPVFSNSIGLLRNWVLLIALPMCWISVASVLNYMENYKFLNQMVLESKPIPLYSNIYHIEFSVFLASVCLLSIFALQRRDKRDAFFSHLLVLVTVLNIICLHVLSARTGIVGFWLALLLSFCFISKGKKWWNLRNFALLALASAIIFMIPSVKNRIINSIDDLRSVGTGKDANNKSFAQRWIAWKVALNSIGAKPVSGYGMGNVETTMHSVYDKSNTGLRPENRKMPHNQWLELGVQSGIFVMFLYLLFYLMGLRFAVFAGNREMFGFLILYAVASMFESILERQSGAICFIVLFSVTAWLDGVDKDKA